MATPIPPRQPIPLERSIRWVPANSHPRSRVDIAAVEPHVIFITQDSLREIEEHARSNAGDDVLGFLLGERFECPDSGAHYVVITTIVRTGHVIAEVEPVQIPDEEWLGIQLEVRRRHLLLLGWYHSAPFVALAPARLDLDTQRARFMEPWQCGLVVSNGAQAAGGFFRDAGAFVPFHELLDDAIAAALGVPRTVVDWQNYVTDTDVAPAWEDDDAFSSVAPTPSGPTTPVLFPTGWNGDATSALPSRPPRRRRPWWLAISTVIVVAAIAAWSVRTHRMPSVFSTSSSGDVRSAERTPATSSAPPAAYGASPSSATSLQAPSSSLARFNRLADSLQLATVNYHTRRSDFDLHRIDCAGLARGYRAADDALVALAALFRDVHTELSPAQIARYEQLGASMDTLNEDFGKSACPRP